MTFLMLLNSEVYVYPCACVAMLCVYNYALYVEVMAKCSGRRELINIYMRKLKRLVLP